MPSGSVGSVGDPDRSHAYTTAAAARMSASLTLGGVDVGLVATFFERLIMIHHPAGHLYNADERVGRDPPEAIERSLAFLLVKGGRTVNG